jgi:flagellar biosynthesis protein FlhB
VAEETGEKSQEATQHRRQQAREEGQVAYSPDLGSAALLLGGLIVLSMAGPALWKFLGEYLINQLGGDPWLTSDAPFVIGKWQELISGLSKPLLPLLGFAMLLAIGAHLMQIGPLFLPEKLTPDFSRIDPMRGLQRLFSMSGVVRLLFGIFKIAIIGAVAFLAVYHRREEILRLAVLDVGQIAWFTWDLCFWTSVKIGMALFILAILDYGYQRYQHEQDLKMTPQEVREEMRNLQGDPQVVARRRNVQRQLALNRLSKAVPTADVVVTNPTELAVALQYDPQTMAAPVVVAKGAGVIAQRIRRLALENGVPIVEKKPLAQALFRDVDVNHPIPDGLYAGVAEVLAYVYQLKGKPLPSAR